MCTGLYFGAVFGLPSATVRWLCRPKVFSGCSSRFVGRCAGNFLCPQTGCSTCSKFGFTSHIVTLLGLYWACCALWGAGVCLGRTGYVLFLFYGRDCIGGGAGLVRDRYGLCVFFDIYHSCY